MTKWRTFTDWERRKNSKNTFAGCTMWPSQETNCEEDKSSSSWVQQCHELRTQMWIILCAFPCSAPPTSTSDRNWTLREDPLDLQCAWLNLLYSGVQRELLHSRCQPKLFTAVGRETQNVNLACPYHSGWRDANNFRIQGRYHIVSQQSPTETPSAMANLLHSANKDNHSPANHGDSSSSTFIFCYVAEKMTFPLWVVADDLVRFVQPPSAANAPIFFHRILETDSLCRTPHKRFANRLAQRGSPHRTSAAESHKWFGCILFCISHNHIKLQCYPAHLNIVLQHQ